MEADIKSNLCTCPPYNTNIGMNTSNSSKTEKQGLDERTAIETDIANSNSALVSLNKAEEMNVYPNPTNNSFTLNSQTETSIETLSIYSISGQLIDKISAINDVRYTYQRFLEKGTYLLLIQADNNKVFHKKIVVL